MKHNYQCRVVYEQSEKYAPKFYDFRFLQGLFPRVWWLFFFTPDSALPTRNHAACSSSQTT